MQRKKLEELDLIDDFLFGVIVSHPTLGPAFCRIILKIILGRRIGKIIVVPQRIYYGTDTDKHGIRLDVYAEESQEESTDVIYDIEPDQNSSPEAKLSLPKRVRFYHAKIDSQSLQSGEDYSCLKQVAVIMITSYDPFGLNRMVYTIRNSCVEVPDLPYNDGAVTLFLYTKGTEGDPPEDLKNLLHYFEESKKENACNSTLETLHEMIESVRHNREVSLEYMKIFEREQMIRAEGLEEGSISSLVSTINKMTSKGMSVSQIASILDETEDFISRILKLSLEHPECSAIEIAKIYLKTYES